MASGWAGDGAVQDQIDSTIDDAVARACRELPRGESNKFCDECGEPIPEARRQAILWVRYCVKCQQEKDLHNNTFSGYNRRGSRIASYADFPLPIMTAFRIIFSRTFLAEKLQYVPLSASVFLATLRDEKNEK